MSNSVVESESYFYSTKKTMIEKTTDISDCLAAVCDGPIVDLGCLDNQLSRELLKTSDFGRRYIGVDFNRNLLMQSRSGEVICADVMQLPFRNNSVAAFILSSSLHEIIRDSDLRDLLTSLKDMLKPGGKVVIRDPVRPERPDEIFSVKLINDTEQNTFRLFAENFEPLRKDAYFKFDSSTMTAQVPAHLVYEYLRHRLFLEEGLDHFFHELDEVYGKLGISELRDAATEACLNVVKADLVNSPLTLERMERYKGLIDIKDSQGKDLDMALRMPTHMLVTLEKPTLIG